MANMKSAEIRSICLLSVFKYFGGVSLIAGLIAGLFGNTLKINVVMPQLARALPFMTKIGPGIPSGLALAVIYGLIIGAGFSILALLYNLFAGVLGGIRVFVKEDR